MNSYTNSIKLLPSTLAAFALYSATMHAQESTPPSTPPVEVPDAPAAEPAMEVPEAPAAITPPPAPADEAIVAPEANPALPGENVEPDALEELGEADGIRLNNAELNAVFEVLAREAGLSYFHNNRISGDNFKVNGYLREGDPLTKMDDLAFNNALTLHRKGNTIYALTNDQLTQLPATEWHYNMRYLRSDNMESHLTSLLKPLLSPTGIVKYETKTNTLIVIDTPYKVQRVQSLLERIDKAKGQVVVEVKILRVNSGLAREIGTDWSASLGANGGIEAVTGINSLLGLPIGTGGVLAGTDPIAAGDLVFSPDQISGVIRALNTSGITKLQNNPVLITEDNEAANIAIVDRVPIITSTTTSGTSTTTSEEVRYRIDEDDPTEPENSREIGTTISVTPTLLPDGTIRLKMRPRAASITEFIDGAAAAGETPNRYPRVLESSLDTIARIPDGHSLVVGGFFSEQTVESNNKVPLLGDIPVVNFFFKSKSSEKEESSLIFVVTPSSYSPENHSSHHRTSNRVKSNLQVKDRDTLFENGKNFNHTDTNMRATWEEMKDASGVKPASSGNRYRVRR